jgi:dGTP triphosphohydrolase
MFAAPRILYSPYFRRLAGITQVVHAAEGEHYRRLNNKAIISS